MPIIKRIATVVLFTLAIVSTLMESLNHAALAVLWMIWIDGGWRGRKN